MFSPPKLRAGRGLLVLLFLLAALPAAAQVYEVPLEQRIDDASLIVEGAVVRSTPFFGPGERQIFTAYRIQVFRVLKRGALDPAGLAEIDMVTPGGRVGDRLEVVTPSLHPAVGERGLFFLEARAGYAGLEKAWVPTTSVQGFVRYRGGKAGDPFRTYADPTKEILEPVARRSGEGLIVLAMPPVDHEPATLGGLTITGLSPGTVHAGVQEVLTISGSGFGTFAGAAEVIFDDTTDGPFGFSSPVDAYHIISWTDSEIRVYVPQVNGSVAAGTGRVSVRDSGGAFTQSSSNLIIEYALTEILSSGSLYRLNLENQNRRGGYTFRYSASTANGGVDITSIPEAVARFEESIAQWRCAVGFNATVDGTTSIQDVGDDGVNIIAFDNDVTPLPGGTLGRTSRFFRSCGGDTWRVTGVDHRFKRDGTAGVSWYFGANPAGQSGSEQDFGSLALHELGHALQLGHVNDEDDLMYFASPPGSHNRVISATGVAAGQDILAHSAPFAACGVTGMTGFDCTAAPTANFVASPLGFCGTSASVDFTDTSLDGPTFWGWTFGDFGTSSLRHPSHNYTEAGIYPVSLTVANANGADVETKNDLIVLSDAPVSPACDPGFVNHDNCCTIGIVNVKLNTIDLSTATNSQGDPLEEDFTCSQFTVLAPGQSYPISITTGPANAEDVRVYVDWNNNGVLASDELAFSSDNATEHSGNITVPAGAVRDTALRMRVLSDYFAQNILSACENIEYGQVENYSVLVADPVAAEPGEVQATLTLTKNSTNPAELDFNWGASCSGGSTDYSLHEGTLGAWYSHSAASCTTGGATSLAGFPPLQEDSYYLIVPLTGSSEGSYGASSSGADRPTSIAACRATQNLTACP